ncbi:MAG: GtrA family protein [Deltaproteobacteria bacterium]|nr:GtrA family protein [Deltaproteobacteria bacterium]
MNKVARLPRFITSVWERLSADQQRFVRFGVVGASGVVVNFAFMALGLLIFGGLEPGVRDLCASALGTVVSVGTNFILNDAWTWGDRKKGVGRRDTAMRFGAFAVGQGMGVALQIGIAAFFRSTLEWNAFLAQAIGIGVGTIVNYIINNRLVFKDKQ